MYRLYANDDNISYGIKKFIVDNTTDISTLPTNITPGSSVLVISTSKIHVLNNQYEWIELSGTPGGNEPSAFLEWEIL